MPRLIDEENRDDWNSEDWEKEIEGSSANDRRSGVETQPGYAGERQREESTLSYQIEPSNNYTPDWPEISRKQKVVAGYRCSKCGLLLVDRWSELLHTHHINGDKSDNHTGNLLVVCVDCHNKIHGFVASTLMTNDRKYLDALRSQQAISK